MRSLRKPLRIAAIFVSASIVEAGCGKPASLTPEAGAGVGAEVPRVAPMQSATHPAPPLTFFGWRAEHSHPPRRKRPG